MALDNCAVRTVTVQVEFEAMKGGRRGREV
jgi:hypothetical protein